MKLICFTSLFVSRYLFIVIYSCFSLCEPAVIYHTFIYYQYLLIIYGEIFIVCI